MKKIKKMFAVMLSLAMVLGMAMTVSAEPDGNDTIPGVGNHAEVTVKGLQLNDTVKFYRIIEPDFVEGVFKDYKVVGNYAITRDTATNEYTPTAKEIVDIADSVTDDDVVASVKVSNTDTKETDGYVVKQDLTVGTYLVLVTTEGSKVYNPMIVSVYYSADDEDKPIIPGEVNANGNFVVNGTTAYVKSSDVTIEKTIDEDKVGGNGKGGSSAISIPGEPINFHIESYVPSYSTEYDADSIVYKITDKLSEGLTLPDPLDVKVYLTSVADANVVDSTNYTLTRTSGQGFEITFTGAYVQGLANMANSERKICVEYTASLNENAGINFDLNQNNVKVEYSNNPDDYSDVEEKKDRTYHYTFGIDAEISGSGSKKTEEIFKVDGNNTDKKEEEEFLPAHPLKDAEFSIYKTSNDYVVADGAKATKTTESDVDGRITFKGLAAGYYVLKETKAPTGYSLNEKEYQVHISPTYDTKGKLMSYTITIKEKGAEGNGNSTTYTATEDNYQENTTSGEMQFVNTADKTISSSVTPTYISNTKLSSLPSTGGIGTTIFTIGGCAIMIIAAGLFFASRKKSSKDAPKEG